VIELIPSSSSFSKPLKFRQNQNIYISSNIDLNCPQSSLITTSWIILNRSSICSNQNEFNQSIQIQEKDLFLLAQTLSNGFYQLKLTVTMVDYPTLISTSSVYIEIISSTMIPNLILFNTLMITHDDHEDLVFNPGKYSIDPNTIIFNKDVNNQ
jgi:hypothetical protein